MPGCVDGTNPSPNCCTKLKEQEPCLCEYAKNPLFKQYVEYSPNAKSVMEKFNVPPPSCLSVYSGMVMLQ